MVQLEKSNEEEIATLRKEFSDRLDKIEKEQEAIRRRNAIHEENEEEEAHPDPDIRNAHSFSKDDSLLILSFSIFIIAFSQSILLLIENRHIYDSIINSVIPFTLIMISLELLSLYLWYQNLIDTNWTFVSLILMPMLFSMYFVSDILWIIITILFLPALLFLSLWELIGGLDRSMASTKLLKEMTVAFQVKISLSYLYLTLVAILGLGLFLNIMTPTL